MDLTEEQWAVLEPLFPDKETLLENGRGRRFRDPRDVFYGVLWELRTGAPWKDLPRRYPPYQTCHRRFQGWFRDGTLEKVLRSLAEHLRRRGKLDLTEAFIDGTHAGAKGGPLVGRTRRGLATKIMVISDRFGLPVAARIATGPRNEQKLVAETIDSRFTKRSRGS